LLNRVPASQVEQRESEAEGFGRGRAVKTSFVEFAGQLEGSNTQFYMTTQPLPHLPDGRPELMAEPVTSLSGVPVGPVALVTLYHPSCLNLFIILQPWALGYSFWLVGFVAHDTGDFPMRPALMGNLVPFTYNLWIGSTTSGE